MPLVACPHCKRKQIVQRELIGLRVACERCDEEFVAKEPRPAGEYDPDAETYGGITSTHVLAGIGLISILGLVAGGIVWAFISSKKEDRPVAQESRPAVVSIPAQATPPVAIEPAVEPREVPPAKPDKRATPDLNGDTKQGSLDSGTKPSALPRANPATRIAGPPVVVRPPDPPKVVDVTPAPVTEVFPQSEPRPAKESPAVPGYYARKIHGFTVIVSRMAYDMSDEADRRPLGYLESELELLAELLPKITLTALAKVPVWVEWDHTLPERGDALAVYYSGLGEALSLKGVVDPRKARTICLLSLKLSYEQRRKGPKSIALLHEMAHVVHDQILLTDNPFVKNAYEQAVTRRLYLNVRHADRRVRDGYASTSAAEYFAEVTCAYLDRINYHPTDRKGLKEYDPVGYELAAKVWGTPDQIEARRREGK